MSQSFFMRIDFIVNIACLLKLSINYWNSFELPTQLTLLNKMQVPVYTAQIRIFSYPELILAIGFRWLAGGNLIDIRHVYELSYPSVHAITKTFLDAVYPAQHYRALYVLRIDKPFVRTIVVSNTLVSWHQENIQIRRHLKEQNFFRLYPTFVQDNTY